MEKHLEKFWADMREYYPDLIRSLTDLQRKSYLSVTDLQTNRTWWSKRALDFLGITENMTELGHEKIKINIHPDDEELYRISFRNRMKEIDVEQPIDYRLMTRSGHYDRFTATCRMIYDKEGKSRFLMILYSNHGIADEVDAITGLHTEHTLMRDLQDYIDRNVPITILKIGIDQFSRMNVLYGSGYSDAILYAVGQELIANKTDKGYAYRMQGAKFAVTFKDITNEELHEIYEKIVKALATKIVISGKRIPLKVSAGAVSLEPNFVELNSVRSRMTYALDQSKHFRHGELVFFNDAVGVNTADNLDLVSAIHQDAIDKHEGFFLCYQPIVECKTGKIEGMEALLRWKKEPYGIVSPNVFINWLEEDACIYDLGNWIIQTALSACKKIAMKIPSFFVNVNVCPAQLERHEFREKLLALVDESGLNRNQCCIELTERCRHLDVAFLQKEVEFFKSKGIKIALDDFGTGTSSIGLVLGLPFDEVKIDMSFIKDIQNKPVNQAMIKSIMDFAKKVQLEICIEGIENKEVQDLLQQYDVSWFQGYYYSKPMPIDEFEKLLY